MFFHCEFEDILSLQWSSISWFITGRTSGYKTEWLKCENVHYIKTHILDVQFHIIVWDGKELLCDGHSSCKTQTPDSTTSLSGVVSGCDEIKGFGLAFWTMLLLSSSTDCDSVSETRSNEQLLGFCLLQQCQQWCGIPPCALYFGYEVLGMSQNFISPPPCPVPHRGEGVKQWMMQVFMWNKRFYINPGFFPSKCRKADTLKIWHLEIYVYFMWK
jgi:hypothetical protein